jgi:hypothetical protein
VHLLLVWYLSLPYPPRTTEIKEFIRIIGIVEIVLGCFDLLLTALFGLLLVFIPRIITEEA